ncbi:hypothetical protein KI387_006744, partial [Taxus chinensis]
MASSSRARSSSPFGFRKASPINGKIMIPRYPPVLSSSSNSYGSVTRSVTPNRARSDSATSVNNFRFSSDSPSEYISPDTSTSAFNSDMAFQRSKENICVTVRFRPLSVRECQRGDDSAWYPDGDTLVRNEYNPSTAYAFGKI